MRSTAQSEFMVSRWLRKRTASANPMPAFFWLDQRSIFRGHRSHIALTRCKGSPQSEGGS